MGIFVELSYEEIHMIIGWGYCQEFECGLPDEDRKLQKRLEVIKDGIEDEAERRNNYIDKEWDCN